MRLIGKLKLSDFVESTTIEELKRGDSCWALELELAEALFEDEESRRELTKFIGTGKLENEIVNRLYEGMPSEDENPIYPILESAISHIDTELVAEAMREAIENLDMSLRTGNNVIGLKERLYELTERNAIYNWNVIEVGNYLQNAAGDSREILHEMATLNEVLEKAIGRTATPADILKIAYSELGNHLSLNDDYFTIEEIADGFKLRSYNALQAKRKAAGYIRFYALDATPATPEALQEAVNMIRFSDEKGA